MLLVGLIIGGLIYWGAKKVKQELKENGPRMERMQKDAIEFQKQMEKLQRENPNMGIPPAGVPEGDDLQSDSE